MFLSSFLILIIVIVVVKVSNSVLVFGGNDRADMDKICCNGMCSFTLSFYRIFENESIFFYFVYNQYKYILYFWFFQ